MSKNIAKLNCQITQTKLSEILTAGFTYIYFIIAEVWFKTPSGAFEIVYQTWFLQEKTVFMVKHLYFCRQLSFTWQIQTQKNNRYSVNVILPRVLELKNNSYNL